MIKRVLVIFPESHLAYAPTIKNLAACLSKDGFDVTIVTFFSGVFEKADILCHVDYIDVSKLPRRILSMKNVMKRLLEKRVKGYQGETFSLVLGVDAIGYMVGKEYFDQTIFLSLELVDLKRIKKCLELGISDLIIQSKARAQYVVPANSSTNIYLLPNSGFYDSNYVYRHNPHKIILFGSIMFQIDDIIMAIKELGKPYLIELHGIRNSESRESLSRAYSDLLESGQLEISNKYIPDEQVVGYLAECGIGICIYDKKDIERDVDIATCPSGKVYNYCNAGVPIIANNIYGMKKIGDYQAGVLLDDVTPQSIIDAIVSITNNYEEYSANARKLAYKYDFEKWYRTMMERIV